MCLAAASAALEPNRCGGISSSYRIVGQAGAAGLHRSPAEFRRIGAWLSFPHIEDHAVFSRKYLVREFGEGRASTLRKL